MRQQGYWRHEMRSSAHHGLANEAALHGSGGIGPPVTDERELIQVNCTLAERIVRSARTYAGRNLCRNLPVQADKIGGRAVGSRL